MSAANISKTLTEAFALFKQIATQNWFSKTGALQHLAEKNEEAVKLISILLCCVCFRWAENESCERCLRH